MLSKLVYVVVDEPSEEECVISAHETRKEAIEAKEAYNAEHGTKTYVSVNTPEEMENVQWKEYGLSWFEYRHKQ